jgi:hypothetical protein
MRKPMRPRFAFAAVFLLLAGCMSTEGAHQLMRPLDRAALAVSPFTAYTLFGVAEVTSLINTQKTITDHILSAASGRDCSTIRAKDEGIYCIDKNKIKGPKKPEVYCYRTLADVNCYADHGGYDARKLPIGLSEKELKLFANR